MDAADDFTRLLGFSGSLLSTSSEGGSGRAGGDASADGASPFAAEGDLTDDARRFHVRVVREVVWSVLRRRGGRSYKTKGR